MSKGRITPCIAVDIANSIGPPIRTQDVVSDLDVLRPNWLSTARDNGNVNGIAVDLKKPQARQLDSITAKYCL